MGVFQKEGVISHLHTAFSRDGAAKEYVQDLMIGSEETSKRLADTILNKNGRVYVCGDGNHDYLYREELEVFQKEGVISHLHTAFSRDGAASPGEPMSVGASENARKEYVETMKKDGRFLLDIWS